MPEFKLEKWYFDAVDEKGQVFIGYIAHLRWGIISLQYTGHTHLDEKQTLTHANSFSNVALPVSGVGSIEVNTSAFTGKWESVLPAFYDTLLTSGKQCIQLHCLCPKAVATVTVNEDVLREAMAYAEKIELSFLPWRIPIHQLYWGRYISKALSIIWIRWVGPVEKNIVYFNGIATHDVAVTETSIRVGDYSLQLSESVDLRKGTLFETVFARFPKIAALFPTSIMKLRENKWLSKAMVYKENNLIETGYAIHEIVRWK
jgi:hypothetical protein